MGLFPSVPGKGRALALSALLLIMEPVETLVENRLS